MSTTASDSFGYTQAFPDADFTDRVVCLPLDPVGIHALGKAVARSFLSHGVRFRLTAKYIFISKETDLRVLQLGGGVHLDLEALGLCDPAFYLLREGGPSYQNAAIPINLPLLIGSMQFASVFDNLVATNQLTLYVPSYAGVYAFKEALPLPYALLDAAVELTVREYRNNSKLYSGKGTNGNGSALLFEELIFPMVISNSKLSQSFEGPAVNRKMLATLRWHAPRLAKVPIIRRDGKSSTGAALQSDERFRQLRRITVAKYPTSSFGLSRYGKPMKEHIRKNPSDLQVAPLAGGQQMRLRAVLPWIKALHDKHLAGDKAAVDAARTGQEAYWANGRASVRNKKAIEDVGNGRHFNGQLNDTPMLKLSKKSKDGSAAGGAKRGAKGGKKGGKKGGQKSDTTGDNTCAKSGKKTGQKSDTMGGSTGAKSGKKTDQKSDTMGDGTNVKDGKKEKKRKDAPDGPANDTKRSRRT